MRTSARSLSLWLVAASLSLSLASAASAVSIDWVSVGSPLNACDVQGSNCFGTVASAYQISKYEVTNAQYAEFLNAKAGALDPLALYNANMNPIAGLNGGITQSGSTTPLALRANMPVNFVSFYDTLRFMNWLNNGPGAATPRRGLPPRWARLVTRNVGASIFPAQRERGGTRRPITTSAPATDGSLRRRPAAVCESPVGTTTLWQL
jgi:hypothetical protein